ncbi:hypothetical protein JCM5296_004877 [Sporobolomyces johnsonii]
MRRLTMSFTFNDFLRLAKKAFKFWKKYQKQQQQQQQQQQHGGQGTYASHTGQGQGQGQGQYQQGAAPYPPAHQQQQQQGGWTQQHGPVSPGGYGAHDGPPTVSSPSPSSPSFNRSASDMLARTAAPKARRCEMVGLPLPRWRSEIDLARSLSRRHRLTTWSLLPPHARPLCFYFASTPFANAPRIWPSVLAATSSSPSAIHRRTFSTSAARFDPKLQYPFYDPSCSFPAPSFRRPSLPSLPSKPPPPKPPPRALKLSIFHLLPAFLRPSYRTLLHLDDDIMDHFDPQKQDMANAANASYVELRNKAIQEGDLMAKAFSESKQAYASGRGGDAHDLSMEGKEHQRNKDRYNAEAAEWIFRENNKTQPPGSVDLHGLYVQESIEYTERAIATAKQQGLSELRVIVGKGNHSPSHLAKIKPAITSLMAREHLTAHLDPHNGGVLVVQLQGQGGGKRGDEMMREMEGSRDNDCVVM